MKRPSILALSILITLQSISSFAAPNRAAGIVDDVVAEGRAEKAAVRQMLVQMDANLAKTEETLTSSIESGRALKKMNLLVDSLTLGAGVVYIAARSVPVKSAGVEKVIQATTTASFVALGLGIISGEALSIARTRNRMHTASEIRAFATSALIKIDTTSRNGLPADVDNQILALRQSLVELKAKPQDSNLLEATFDHLASASLAVGILSLGSDLYRASGMMIGEMSVMGGVAIAASTLIRMGSYLSPSDQREVLAKIRAARASLGRAAAKLE